MQEPRSNQEKTADLGDVRLDLDRRRRCGFPEVVFGESKDVATLKRVIQTLLDEREPVLITRLTVEKGTELAVAFPEGRYNAVARTFRVDRRSLTPSGTSPASDVGPHAGPSRREGPTVAIVTAGTVGRGGSCGPRGMRAKYRSTHVRTESRLNSPAMVSVALLGA